jgi:hypothetical protein
MPPEEDTAFWSLEKREEGRLFASILGRVHVQYPR